jgi:hypothetical protein
MNIYKSALKKKVRFKTPKGLLALEQLFDLSLKELDELAIELEKEVENSPKKSFLEETSEEDKLAKLKFEVAYDVLKTKIEARDKAQAAMETRKRNRKITEIIANKKDKELEEKSVEELEKMLDK